MAVRVIFRDPAKSDKVYSTATRWEVTDKSEVIIKTAGDVIAQLSLNDIFALEKE